MEDTLRTLYNMEIKMVYVLEARRKSVFLGKSVQQKRSRLLETAPFD